MLEALVAPSNMIPIMLVALLDPLRPSRTSNVAVSLVRALQNSLNYFSVNIEVIHNLEAMEPWTDYQKCWLATVLVPQSLDVSCSLTQPDQQIPSKFKLSSLMHCT